MIDYTNNTYKKLFDDIQARQGQYDYFVGIGFDFETPELARARDAYGRQIKIHEQFKYGGLTFGYVKTAYNPISGKIGSTSGHHLLELRPGVEISRQTEEFFKKHEAKFGGFTSWKKLTNPPKSVKNMLAAAEAGAYPASQESYNIIHTIHTKYPHLGLIQPESTVSRVFQTLPLKEGKKTLSLLVGYNVNFDLAVLRGMKEFKGVRGTMRTLDLYHAMQRMFPELAVSHLATIETKGRAAGRLSQTGAYKLENIVSLILGRKEALEFYGMEEAPAELKAVKPHVEALIQQLGVLGQHTAEFDVKVLAPILDAVLARSQRNADYARIWNTILAQSGIIPGLGADMLQALKTTDPARVAASLLGEGRVGVQLRKAAPQTVFRRHEFNRLFKVLEKKFGIKYTKHIKKFANFISKHLGQDATFVLRGHHLAVGLANQVDSFISLPTQKIGTLDSAAIYYGNKLRVAPKVTRVHTLGATDADFSEIFLERLMDFYRSGKTLQPGNAQQSLKTAVETVLKSPIYVGGDHTVITLGQLLRSGPFVSGQLAPGELFYTAHERVLSNVPLHKTLSRREAIEASQSGLAIFTKYNELIRLQTQFNIALAKGGDLTQINTRRLAVYNELAAELKKLGHEMPYSSADFLADATGGIRIIKGLQQTLGSAFHLKDLEKGLRQIRHRRTLADIEYTAFRKAGYHIGPRYISESLLAQAEGGSAVAKAALRSSVETRTLLIEFGTDRGVLERGLLGDSSALITKSGLKKLYGTTVEGPVTIKGWTLEHLKHLNTLAGREVINPQELTDFVGQGISHVGTVYDRTIKLPREFSKEQLEAIKALGSAAGGEPLLTRGMLRNAIISRIAVDENEIKFFVHSTRRPAAQSIILGTGRFTIGGVLRGRHGKSLSKLGIDLVIEASDARGILRTDALVSHKLSVLHRAGDLENFLRWVNEEEAFAKQFGRLRAIGGTLVIPKGTDSSQILPLLQKYKELKLRKKIGNSAKLRKAYNEFEGIFIGKYKAAKEFAEALEQIGKPVRSLRALYTEFAIRADAASDVNITETARFTARHLSTLMMKSRILGYEDPMTDPLVAALNSKLLKQTGYTMTPFGVVQVAATSKGRVDKIGLQAIGEFLTGTATPTHKTVIHIETEGKRRGQFYLVGRGKGGTTQRIYLRDLPDIPAGARISDKLEGTVLAKEIREGGAILKLPKKMVIPLQVGEKSASKLIERELLYLPPEKFLGLIGETGTRVSGTHPLHDMYHALRALSALVKHGSLAELDRIEVNYPQVAKAGRSPTIPELFGRSYSALIKKAIGKDGVAAKLGVGYDILSTRPRLVSRLIEIPTNYTPRPEDVADILTAYVDEDNLIRVIKKSRLSHEEKAKLIKRVRKLASSGDVTYSLLRSDPMLRPDHTVLTRLKIVKRGARLSGSRLAKAGIEITPLGSAGGLALHTHPLLASLLERDFDKDSLFFALTEGLVSEKNQAALKERFKKEVERHGKWFTAALHQLSTLEESAERKKVGSIIQSIIDDMGEAGADITGKALEAFVGMKLYASYGYTPVKGTGTFIHLAAGINDTGTMVQVLKQLGADTVRPTDEVVRALVGLTPDEALAASNLLGWLRQDVLSKGGEAKAATYGLLQALSEAGQATTTAEAAERISQEFVKSMETPELRKLYKPGTIASLLPGQEPHVIEAARAFGKTYAAAIRAGSKYGKSIGGAIALQEFTGAEGLEGIVSALAPGMEQEIYEGVSRSSGNVGQLAERALEAIQPGDSVYSKLKDLIFSRGGMIALGGLAAFGVYNMIAGPSPDNAPLPVPDFSGSPLPPAPKVARNTDAGIRNVPQLHRNVAYISRAKPYNIPYSGAIRQYKAQQYYRLRMNSPDIYVSYRDQQSEAQVKRRMRDLYKRDFVR